MKVALDRLAVEGLIEDSPSQRDLRKRPLADRHR